MARRKHRKEDLRVAENEFGKFLEWEQLKRIWDKRDGLGRKLCEVERRAGMSGRISRAD